MHLSLLNLCHYQIYVMLFKIFFFTFGRSLLSLMRTIFFTPHYTSFGTSYQRLSMLQELSRTTTTW